MAEFSRRVFILRSSLMAGAAGALSAVPGLAALFNQAESEAPSLDSGASADVDEAASGLSGSGQPIVAHVRDISTGEVGILNGTREVVVRDPGLVARLIRVSR